MSRGHYNLIEEETVLTNVCLVDYSQGQGPTRRRAR